MFIIVLAKEFKGFWTVVWTEVLVVGCLNWGFLCLDSCLSVCLRKIRGLIGLSTIKDSV